MQKLKIRGCYFAGFLALGWNASRFCSPKIQRIYAGFCHGKVAIHEHSPKVYSALCLLVVGLIPVGTMFVLYSRVVYSLWLKPKRNPSFAGFSQLAVIKNRQKVTKIVLIVSTVYTLCWIPELCIYTTSAYSPALVEGNIAYPVSVAMVTVNSAVNPVIYCFHSERFRRHLKALICRGRLKSISLGDGAVEEDEVCERKVRGLSLRAKIKSKEPSTSTCSA